MPLLGVRARAQTQCPISFAAQATFNAGSRPVAVAVGDFNRDGKLDLVVVNNLGNTVSILLGNGNGTFQQSIPYAVGIAPQSVVVGDFNHDGKLDIAVANLGTTATNGSVSILLGNGDGTFQGDMNIPSSTTTAYPSGIELGDFNGDGRLDLAFGNTASNAVNVLLGNGDGTFVRYGGSANTLGHPAMVVVGDFNRDGKDDMAVPDYGSNSVSLFMGNGNATFQSSVNYLTGSNPLAVVTADLNGDGRLDLAVANSSSSNVSVFLGNGNGTFQGAVNYSAGSDLRGLAVGDMNGDGRPDIMVSNGDNHVSILIGNGDGTFQPPSQYAIGSSSPQGLALGDFDGDGRLDIVVASDSSGNVTVLRQVTSLGPVIAQPPASASVLPATTATFSVSANPSSGLTYQWRRNGVNLANAPTGTGSVTTGVGTPTLTVSNASYADNGSAFDCVVTNTCGSKLSDPAGLAVGPHCRADYNANGTIEVVDIFAFLNAWFAGCP